VNTLLNIPTSLRSILLIATVLLASISLAQTSAPLSVPASRQADRVAIITIEGAIDAITAMSVRRRIGEAEDAGYNAIVFEINSPGGGVGAVLDITNTIKSSSINNTIAWVNTDAYSGGAIIALACKEIISSSPGAMGDAFPVIMTAVTQGNQTRGGLRGLTPDERTKLLPPLLADVTDSARRNGYDEYLVQAIVIDGIELWQIENTNTLQRYAINEAEYRTLFNEDPPRGMPLIAQVTGGRPTGVTDPDPLPESEPDSDAQQVSDTDSDAETEPVNDQDIKPDSEPDAEQSSQPIADQAAPQQQSTPTNTTDFRPASDTLDDVVKEFNATERIAELTLETHSSRPVFTAADKDRYRPIAYITDGSAPIVMREQQLIDLGFSSGIIQTDEQLQAFMGATTLARANESWSEGFVRFMTSMPVRGVLIAIFLIAIFIELITPGTGIGGSVALITLIAMIAPPAMIGLAGWWEIIAIIVGLLFLAIEAFVVPGFGFFGIVGLVSLFAGILWTFIPAGSSLTNPNTQQDLMGAIVTVLLGSFSAGIIIWLISRNLDRIPIFDKLILASASGIGAEPREQSVFSAMLGDEPTLQPGNTGTTTTDLRPSGQADILGNLTDVVAEFGYIEAGTPIRVTAVESFRIVVDRISEEQHNTQNQNDPEPGPDQDKTDPENA
jgi:membrane-bound ClpP family serine protease